MLKWILTLLFFGTLFGADEEVLDQPENFPIESKSFPIAPRVNPITGDYLEEALDLVVAGLEPLSVRRFYCHTSAYEPRYAGWLINPETYLAANFELSLPRSCFVAIGNRKGHITCLEQRTNSTFTIKDVKSHPDQTGLTHPLNLSVTYGHIRDPDNLKRFRWDGIIQEGDGTEKLFTTPMHTWMDKIRFKAGKKGFLQPGSSTLYKVYPPVWTPYYLNLIEEKRPNGTILEYSYIHWKENPHWPTPPLLNTITALTPDRQTTIATLTFTYTRDKQNNVTGITVEGSDGRSIYMSTYGRAPIMLSSVTSSNPDITYHTKKNKIVHVNLSHGCFLSTTYTPDNKVDSQYAPVGPNGEIHPISRYIYHIGATEVYDAENNKTVYRYDPDNRLLSLDTYQNGKEYSIQRTTWDPETGNPLKKTLEDASGTPFLTSHYQYDKNHNLIQEKVGRGDNWRTITRTYYPNNLLKTYSDRENKVTHYTYKPNTNLPLSELIYIDNHIQKRTFHFYDKDHCLIKTLLDDGSTQDPNDLTNVTYRLIKELTPKKELPCFGYPRTIREKTTDAQGKEDLLHTTHYTYAPTGKILTEEHYDAHNTYCYTLTNTYDTKERLISKTDPLGNTTHYTYDHNHNITSIKSPNTLKTITYDHVNRPIQISEQQTDGTFLNTTKTYDRLGNLLTQTDPGGNTTTYTYDALNRLTTITHPTGDTEHKTYDIQGNIIEEIDAKGYSTHKTYNPFGQVTEIHYPDGTSEHFTYTQTGQKASHTDQNGLTTHFIYDAFDHPIKTYTAYSQTTATYTPFTKLTQTDPQGIVTTWTYDFAGRKLSEQTAQKITYNTYDALGNLVQTQDGDTLLQHTYDYKHKLLAHISHHLSDNSHALSQHLASQQDEAVLHEQNAKCKVLQFQEKYTYNPKGECTHITTAKGTYQTHYNTQGKPLLQIDPQGNQTTYTYQSTLLETKTSPKGTQTLTTYDPKGRIAKIIKKNPQGEILSQTHNTYDPNNNLTPKASTTAPINTPTSITALLMTLICMACLAGMACGRGQRISYGEQVAMYGEE